MTHVKLTLSELKTESRFKGDKLATKNIEVSDEFGPVATISDCGYKPQWFVHTNQLRRRHWGVVTEHPKCQHPQCAAWLFFDFGPFPTVESALPFLSDRIIKVRQFLLEIEDEAASSIYG